MKRQRRKRTHNVNILVTGSAGFFDSNLTKNAVQMQPAVETDFLVNVLARTPRDIDSCWGDNALISKELGWEPCVT